MSSYSFTVTATDAAGNASAAQAVSLAINNLDDVAPTITADGMERSMNDSRVVGHFVYTVTSTDTGDIAVGSTSYSLGGDDAGAFSINSSTGAVTLTDSPDFEAKSS